MILRYYIRQSIGILLIDVWIDSRPIISIGIGLLVVGSILYPGERLDNNLSIVLVNIDPPEVRNGFW